MSLLQKSWNGYLSGDPVVAVDWDHHWGFDQNAEALTRYLTGC